MIQVACLLMLIQGIFNKFGAAFIIIPEPIIGGIFCVMFGMITAFGKLSLPMIVRENSPNFTSLFGSLIYRIISFAIRGSEFFAEFVHFRFHFIVFISTYNDSFEFEFGYVSTVCSSRRIAIFQALPKWMIQHPDAIQTGLPILDNILTVLLSTSILVGGLLGCLMDNLIPGILQY